MSLALISQLLGLLPAVIEASDEVIGLINRAKAAIDSGADPSDEQWTQLNAELDALTARLNKDP